MSLSLLSLFHRKSESESKGLIFYHYTNRDAAYSISQSGRIRNNGNGVMLTTMSPECYFRNEILQNNYGFNVPVELAKNADYCVRVLSKRLIEENLKKLKLPGDRLIYLYDGDIRVKELDVFDKPKCKKGPPKMESDIKMGKNQHSSPSTSSSSSTRNFRTDTTFTEGHKTSHKTVKEIHINLRNDVKLTQRNAQEYQDKNVRIFAFKWVEEGLKRIRKAIGDEILVHCKDSDGNHIQDQFSGDLSLKILHMFARNEATNTNGIIEFKNYIGISEEVVYSLKDLVRQTVIVGKDQTTNYGGYPHGYQRVAQQDVVYLCDLIGLQFQQEYNSGRLVIVGENLPKGLLDDFIYEHVVKEKKPTMEQVRRDGQQRFIECSGVFFDSKAYVEFVANDVILAGMALNHCATEPLNFKFLKYGTGYFAGQFSNLLQKFIGQGVAKGLRLLLERLPKSHMIKRVELPFYSQNFVIDYVCSKYNIEVNYGTDDCLKKTHCKYTTATTNCADSHAMTGNKMGFGSIDGAIAENIRGKAIKFTPFINELMEEILI